MSHDEKSQAQQDKESHVKKVEEEVKKVYTDLFDKHQKTAVDAREDEPDTAETEEEYRERIKNVPGLFSDSYAYGNNVEQGEDVKEETDEASEDSDTGDNAAADPDVAKAASKSSPASDNTKPATALENQKTEEKKEDAKKDEKKDESKKADVKLTGTVSEKN